jgi:integrase
MEVAIHPNLPDLYRRKVARLQQVLADEASRPQVVEIIRSLIDRIEVHPGKERGHCDVLLVGALAQIIAFGQQKTTAASLRGHRVNIKRDWRQLCKTAEITGLRVHDLRHSFASALASGGASLPLIGALLGHATPATTARYAHLHSDPLREATERVGAVIVNAGKAAPAPVKLKGGVS